MDDELEFRGPAGGALYAGEPETEERQNGSTLNGANSFSGRMDRFEQVCVAAAIPSAIVERSKRTIRRHGNRKENPESRIAFGRASRRRCICRFRTTEPENRGAIAGGGLQRN